MKKTLKELGFTKGYFGWVYSGPVEIGIESTKGKLYQISVYVAPGAGMIWPKLLTIDEIEILIGLSK
jgi:hypothetical protein